MLIHIFLKIKVLIFQKENPMNLSVIFNSIDHFVNAPFHLFEVNLWQFGQTLNFWVTACMIFLQTYVNWNSDIPYIPPRYVYDCMISAVSPRPYPVEKVMVTSCSVNDSIINLYLNWSPPSVINGALDSYDICLGNVPLEPNEEISNKSHDCRKSKQNVC